MIKKALCIRKRDLDLKPDFSGVFDKTNYASRAAANKLTLTQPLACPTYLLKREDCETDAHYLQLIPYAILRKFINGKPYFAVYKRGTGGTEDRLHHKWSIGIGGHVDTEPGAGVSLAAHLAAECGREINEEIVMSKHLLIGTEIVKFDHTNLQGRISDCTYIYLSETPVDRVHLGLAFIVDIAGDIAIDSREPEQVCDLIWMSLDDLYELSHLNKLENWSCIAVQQILTARSISDAAAVSAALAQAGQEHLEDWASLMREVKRLSEQVRALEAKVAKHTPR